jgi:hypothetical protein
VVKNRNLFIFNFEKIMKKFIIKSLLYLMFIFVLASIGELILRCVPNDYSYKKHYLDIHANEIQTLILGNSHTYYGINPVYFSGSTFNASHISQSLEYDYEILKRYDEKLTSLQTVILPVSYFTLWSNLISGTESWRIKNYIIYYGITRGNEPVKFHFELSSNSFKTNIERLKSYFTNKNNITYSPSGWGTNYSSKNPQDLEETGKTAARRHKKNLNLNENKKTFEYNISVLDSIANICRKHNAKLFLFTPPSYKTYRQNLDPNQLNETIKTANTFTSRNPDCIYLNLLTDTTFIPADYYDADHLSEKGAEKLSSLINTHINKESSKTAVQ